ncbi:thiamin-phosphate pyrophosphorylase [Fructilactobacillus fructivorans]|nr:thiamin-phosphate pyrophosphorylase [Fructilactobacillus fructivorans]
MGVINMQFNKKALQIYLVAGTQNFAGSDAEFVNHIEQALSNGVTAFQYREKGPGSLTGQRKIEMGKKLRKITTKHHVPLIVDDDVNLANEINADGIHVGQSDESVQKIIHDNPNLIVGLSISTESELEYSKPLIGINYLGIGPIFPTISKADAKPPIGINGLVQLQNQVSLPVVAIGGINTSNCQSIYQASKAGIAVISVIMDSKNVKETIDELERK